MIIIIGLGNPGEQYKNTRHNVGFMAVDEFAKKNDFPEFEVNKKSNSLISEEKKVLLAKPQTFMNESGKAVRSLAKTYNLKSTNLVVIHDDVDLPIGKIKVVAERGSAGHKGVESIIKSVGNKGLTRIRIGTGGKKNVDAMKIVLKNFTPDEKKLIDKTIKKVSEALSLFIAEGLEKTMNEFNR